MSEENKGQTGFDLEYVKELRQEAAEWRTKYRGLEERVVQAEVRAELKERGVKADPSWVKVAEGKTVNEAVEEFVQQYPHLVATPDSSVTENPGKAPVKKVTKPMVPGDSKNSNLPGPKPVGKLDSNTLKDIKKDAKARGQLRDLYKDLIRNSTNNRDAE